MRLDCLCSRAISVFTAFVLFSSLCLAQNKSSDASLEVVVKDPSGAVVHNARVQLRSSTRQEPATQTTQKGEARFSRLTAGRYQVHVEAPGFKAKDIDEVDLHTGSNRTEVVLEIDPIKADVEVSEEARTRNSDPKGPAFTNVLTADQIAQLPDDPDEFENAINQLAGPGAQMRVNGFKGGKLPPKSQIREIRFRMNPYAAENHDAGFGFVDITTKPGVNSWHGSFNAGFRDESLSGRQAFAKVRGPEQQRRFGLAMDGPLWKDHTSLFLNADGSVFYDAKTIVATLPTGPFSDLAFRPSRRLNLDARVEHALNKTHTSRFEYQRNAVLQNNLGVGDFDLASRAFSQNQTEQLLRFGDSGVLGKKSLTKRDSKRVGSTPKRARPRLDRRSWSPAHSTAAARNEAVGVINLNSKSPTMLITPSRTTVCASEFSSKQATIAVTIRPTPLALFSSRTWLRIRPASRCSFPSGLATQPFPTRNISSAGTFRMTIACART